MGAFFVTV